MTDVSDLFWQSTLQEIKRGYIYQHDRDEFVCLICGKSFANGSIYQNDGQLYEARKYIQVHIEQDHGSTFEFLLNMDKKLTGLTDHQKSILELFYKGYTDNEVANHLNTGSISTIRNHRFSLKEKQKQAKIFLAIMELLGDQVPKKQTFVEIARDAKQAKNHLVITQEENEKVLAAYFREGPEGPLQSYPLKEKKRVIILNHLIKNFDPAKTYTEKQVNTVLGRIYTDHVLLRRQLIEHGFMDRTPDGSSYWVTS